MINLGLVLGNSEAIVTPLCAYGTLSDSSTDTEIVLGPVGTFFSAHLKIK